ncbi:MAG: flavodoxin domain-containing protein [Lachnospiraceae bacterium]|jgi:menaquinone-dependent protoporphyrinogen IX oxidase
MTRARAEAERNIKTAAEEMHDRRVLILFSTRTGTTEKAAMLLAQYFKDADVRNIKNGRVTPERYDIVIVGSYVRNGMVDPDVRSWLIKNEKALYRKSLSFFFCNAFIERAPSIMTENFPEAFIEECVCIDSFGGEINTGKLNFLEKLQLNSVMRKRKGRSRQMIPCLMTDRIEVFANTVKSEA